jgi:hypothetical protein
MNSAAVAEVAEVVAVAVEEEEEVVAEWVVAGVAVVAGVEEAQVDTVTEGMVMEDITGTRQYKAVLMAVVGVVGDGGGLITLIVDADTMVVIVIMAM